MSELELRRIEQEEDQRAAFHLGNLAFGGDRNAVFNPEAFDDSAIRFGLFNGTRLTAKLNIRPYAQFFGRREVAMGGIAGVAVAPEDRGLGLAQRLLSVALEQMRDEGQVISTLYQTALGLYRSMGWELGGSMPSMTIRTRDLARAPRVDDLDIRACSAADLSEVATLYTDYARGRNGMLSRTGPSFPRGVAGLLELDGAPLVIRDGTVVGYATYARGTGYGPDSRLEVHDLVGVDAAATSALLHHLSTWSSVSPTVRLRWSPDEVSLLLLPDSAPAPEQELRWMLRIVDIKGALLARGWPVGLEAHVELDVLDEIAPWNAGPWTLSVSQGRATIQQGGSGTLTCSIGALAALYSNAFDTRALVRAGLLTGSDTQLDLLDLMFAGPPSIMWDYF